MKCVVVGAGAWGLPAAAELARRGHEVTLVDQFGIANEYSSSAGPSRMWRLAHPDARHVRLALRGVDAMDRLAQLSGRGIYLKRGLLWRDAGSHTAVMQALTNENVQFDEVDQRDVERYFPGLIPNDRPAIWTADAGPVLAAESIRAQTELFERYYGQSLFGRQVADVEERSLGLRVNFTDGTSAIDADAVVLAPGPGARTLLLSLGYDIDLNVRLEQVVHFGDPLNRSVTDQFPCLVDGGFDEGLFVYALPTPGVGYKVGMNSYRGMVSGDLNRSPDLRLIADAQGWIQSTLPLVKPEVLHVQVCTWTDSPDEDFIIDRLPSGLVIACGDSGQGFKFSALMGLILAELTEGKAEDEDIKTFGLSRFD